MRKHQLVSKKYLILFAICFGTITCSSASRADCSPPITDASVAGNYLFIEEGPLGITQATSEMDLYSNGSFAINHGEIQNTFNVDSNAGFITFNTPHHQPMIFPSVQCGAGTATSGVPEEAEGYDVDTHATVELRREISGY